MSGVAIVREAAIGEVCAGVLNQRYAALWCPRSAASSLCLREREWRLLKGDQNRDPGRKTNWNPANVG
jgi:hypothetical protein